MSSIVADSVVALTSVSRFRGLLDPLHRVGLDRLAGEPDSTQDVGHAGLDAQQDGRQFRKITPLGQLVHEVHYPIRRGSLLSRGP